VRDEVGKQNSRSRYIPIFIQRVVQNQDDHSCRFVSPITGKRCGSRYRLQFEHKKPFAKGGAHSVKNLKILCQSHNLLMAEKQFGKEKMSQYQASLKKIQPTLKELRSHT
jgi:5-methylcytosine-specific restriction endonuclease McrA